ncbi:MAG: PhzF family phenazine biosynthesis protein [Zoogloeaceae bacterium]|nr:PhzF family phenazine biosynthesis protein [Rhodocyclaceae bacterium]MCP5235691.1 PhzF family phenazine biosynthesis protein [Zoogloeaceae bacterium]
MDIHANRIEDARRRRLLPGYATCTRYRHENSNLRNIFLDMPVPFSRIARGESLLERLVVISIRYQLWDVFTDAPLTGNQLAVIPEGDRIPPQLMQRIANEFSLPETSFLLSATSRDSNCRFRIFTPQRELPMAGHPTIGSTFALARLKRIQPGATAISVELGIGPTSVDLVWRKDRLESAWMAQNAPEFGPVCQDAESLGRTLGLDSSRIANLAAPAQILSSGVPLLFVCLTSRADVDRVALNRAALTQCLERMGVEECPVYVFSLEPADDGALTYSRMFAPVFGIEEDPATGGASGPLFAYVRTYYPNAVTASGPFLNRQGVKLGRPSEIYMRPSPSGEEALAAPLGARIGGHAVFVGEGTLSVQAKA